jgi:hypothetical protein
MPDDDRKAEKPWKGVCCSRCYKAKSEKNKCKCKCHGEYHGLACKKIEDIPHGDHEDIST